MALSVLSILACASASIAHLFMDGGVTRRTPQDTAARARGDEER